MKEKKNLETTRGHSAWRGKHKKVNPTVEVWNPLYTFVPLCVCVCRRGAFVPGRMTQRRFYLSKKKRRF